MADNIRNRIQETTQGQGAQGLMDTATEGMRSAASTASDIAAQAKERVGEWASGAAEGIEAATGNVRDWGTQAIGTTGETMQSAGKEVSAFIRQHPIPSLLAAFGVGFCLSCLMTDRR
jgi:ElaB/YqjD/DUF883 family membrane-anchored ribosome-binding protein